MSTRFTVTGLYDDDETDVKVSDCFVVELETNRDWYIIRVLEWSTGGMVLC